jgi:alpha/beta hydrolase family protein
MSDRSASVSGPIPGAIFLGSLQSYDLAALGYSNDEYFLEGTARSYGSAAAAAPYRTRAVVRRPLDAARWNGSVVVEWLNVSGGVDASPDWSFAHRHLVREGFAWVGVSAQRAGIEGGGFAAVSFPLKKVNAERYASLEHPGDAFAFDLFSQAGRAARDGRLLGGLVPRRVLAIGESQSAMFLVTYVNEVDADARVFDGFLVHGRGGRGASLEGSLGNARSLTEVAAGVSSGRAGAVFAGTDRIRSDLRVPVLTLQSETDVIGLGSVGARQPDAERFRLWEIAGSAHADTYLLVASASDDGSLAPAKLAELLAPTRDLIAAKVDTPVNAGPQQHYVLQAALAHLDRWAAGGAPPPQAPLLELAGAEGPLALDDLGIAKGGIRTPWVEVPTGVLSGFGQSGTEFAFLFGTTRPFDAAALARLYPGGRSDYLARFDKATSEAVARGFLLEEDAAEIRAVAQVTPWPSRS